jgi:choline monooxygenase
VYTDNYGEGYHIPLVHPALNRELVAKEYRVEVGDHFCRHSAPARDGAVNAGAWLWRYPNLALNIYPGGMNVERFVPVDPTHTRIVYDYFFADLDDREQNAAVERMGCAVLDEDRAICENVQRNLAAGVYTAGLLSPRHENGVAAFHRWLEESLRA